MPGGLDDPTEAATRLRRLATGSGRSGSEVTIAARESGRHSRGSRKLREIYNQAWRNNWGFVPFTESGI